MTKSTKTLGKIIAIAMVMFMFFGALGETFAQDYEFSTKYRRMGNKIGIELWVKSLNSSAGALGSFTYPVTYNTSFLQPAALTYTAYTGDSVSYDVDQASPLVTLTSPFHSANGYGALTIVNGTGYAEFEVTFNSGTGYVPSTSGRGTFVGRIEFDIINYATLGTTDMASIVSKQTGTPSIAVTDVDGNALTTADYRVVDATNIAIKGISVLNPNGPNEVVNRYFQYESLGGTLYGYPIYFERSGLVNTATYSYGTDYVAYNVAYSVDGGSTYTNTFRFAETSSQATVVNYDNIASGDIETTTGTLPGYSVTKGNGDPVPMNWKGVLRVIWKGDEFFAARSEKARIKFTQLSTTGQGADIDNRTLGTITGVSEFNFVLGRTFFVQLDGSTQYLRTAQNYSLPTQITVEAWVNVNALGADGTEPGLIASSAGADSPSEGAFLLYLDNGKYPAFRVREFKDRGYDGTSIYLGKVVSNEAITAVSSDIELSNDAASETHRNNWVHLAGVVNNNVVELYVNGQRVGKTTNTQAVDTRMAYYEHPIWIGVNPTGGIQATDLTKAGFKEVKIWRTALTAEEILAHVAGVLDPSGATYPLGALDNVDSLRISLDMYYTLQANRDDYATDVTFQDGNNVLNHYTSETLDNSGVNYRPDRPHIRLIAPYAADGVMNKEDDLYQIRWVGFGLGSVAPNSEDLQIEYSRDGGTTWADALDNTTSPSGLPLDQVEIEDTYATWEPYNSVTYSGAYSDLQGLGNTIDQNYTKTVKLRISGKTSNNQDDIYDVSDDFYVAPYFTLRNGGTTEIYVPGSTDFNLSRGVSFIEMWVYPEQFPTAGNYYTLVEKGNGTNTHYSLRLTSAGLLQFVLTDASGTTHTATSDATKPLVTPNQTLLGKVWTHIGVLVNLANGSGTSNIRFYIDGLPQTSDAITTQLGSNITTNVSNTYPLYIASSATGTTNFVGEVREFRYWNGYPADMQISGVESQANPTDLTKFVQGALTSYAKDFLTTPTNYQKNLVAAFAFDGGSFVNNGWYKSFSSTDSDHQAIMVGDVGLTTDGASYQSTKPYIKLVEPILQQEVANTTTDLRVRWVGFHFDETSFREGSNALNQNSDLSYGLFGGGGQVIQPYQYVASDKYAATYTNSLELGTTTSLYRFPGTSATPQYAGSLNVYIADPDVNNDETYNDQGPLAASLTNARLRLRGRATINASIPWEYTDVITLETEGPVFTITPPSNFTVRALLEGFHQGSNNNITNTGSTYDALGVKVSLFSESAGQPNTLVATKEGTGYITSQTSALDPTTRGVDGSYFADLPFVFTTINDGNYFVVVEHLNHLPAMSRFAAPFSFDGDDLTTWNVESGWDFQSWGQNSTPTADDYMEVSTDDIYSGTGLYSAYGSHEISSSIVGYDQTSLNFSAGQISSTSNRMAALVAGDTYRDGQINALDRVLVRADIGSSVYRSDVTGDGLINAIDRDLTDRNSNKITRLTDLGVVSYTSTPSIWSWIATSDPLEAISPLNPTRSEEMNKAAKEFIANGAKYADKKNNNYKLQGCLSYKVMGSTEKVGDIINVTLYLQNTGGDWAPGNCTFGITYETNKLEFVELINTNDNPFNNFLSKGYSETYSGPTKDGNNPIANLRTIEIDYDGYVRPEGVIVPNTWTKLGTLSFKIANPSTRYEFGWHEITAVLTTDGRIITGDGEFLPIEPVDVVRTVSVISPNGGETWRGGKFYTITWALPSDDAFGNLEYSDNAGATWNAINIEPISLMSGSYDWKTPEINSNKCLVRIVDTRNNNEIDRSDALFSISEDVIKITRPASTDPTYKFGKSDYIEWTMEDMATIRFEFSANGKDNWYSVTGPISSRLLQTKWDIPAVNTKDAVVRMVDVNTGKILAYSTPFRILGGSATFINPKKGQLVKCGNTEPVRWTYEFIDKFDLQLSVDGGNTWDYIAKEVNTLKGVYQWKVPQVKTETAIIRAIWNGQEDMEYGRTGIFRIDCDGIGAVEELVDMINFLNEPVPNPFADEARISFNLSNPTKVTVKVYDMTGELIATLVENTEFAAGTHSLSFNGINLPAGVYIIRLNAGTVVDTKELIHVK